MRINTSPPRWRLSGRNIGTLDTRMSFSIYEDADMDKHHVPVQICYTVFAIESKHGMKI